MPLRTSTRPKRFSGSSVVRQITHRESTNHADEAFAYFRRIRGRLYKDPQYRGRFIAIRDRRVVDVDDDKIALYERLVSHFPDHRFVVSQVLHELPSIEPRD